MPKPSKIGAPALSDETQSEKQYEVKVERSFFRDVLVGVSVIVGGGVAWHFLSKWLNERERERMKMEAELYGIQPSAPLPPPVAFPGAPPTLAATAVQIADEDA
jgi:hypothetical protein